MGRKRKTPDLVTEVLAGQDHEQGHKEKLRKYSGAKQHSVSVAEYILANEPTLCKTADQVRACSTWLVFRHFYLAGQYRLIGGCTCKKHLLCAMCALRRSAKTVMAYSAKLSQAIENAKQGERATDGSWKVFPVDLIPVLITLTIKNGEDLEERFLHLNDSISRMIRNRSLAANGNRHLTVFRLLHGGAGAFEFKRGSGSGLWHPHMHMIALVSSQVDILHLEWNLSEEWRKLTVDSFNVDVTPIDTSSEESRMKAICEVFRYALKFGEMTIEDQVHAFKVLHSRRLVRSFGSLRGVPEPTDTADTIEDALQLQPYIDMIYEYSNKKGYFLKELTDVGDSFSGRSPEVKEEQSKFSSIVRKSNSHLNFPDHLIDRSKRLAVDRKYVNDWLMWRESIGRSPSVSELSKINF